MLLSLQRSFIAAFPVCNLVWVDNVYNSGELFHHKASIDVVGGVEAKCLA